MAEQLPPLTPLDPEFRIVGYYMEWILGPNEILVLEAIGENGYTGSQLATETSLNMKQIMKSLATLRTKGLVCCIHNPRSVKKTVFRLSKPGKAVFDDDADIIASCTNFADAMETLRRKEE